MQSATSTWLATLAGMGYTDDAVAPLPYVPATDASIPTLPPASE
jgi:hypothetical protein